MDSRSRPGPGRGFGPRQPADCHPETGLVCFNWSEYPGCPFRRWPGRRALALLVL